MKRLSRPAGRHPTLLIRREQIEQAGWLGRSQLWLVVGQAWRRRPGRWQFECGSACVSRPSSAAVACAEIRMVGAGSLVCFCSGTSCESQSVFLRRRRSISKPWVAVLRAPWVPITRQFPFQPHRGAIVVPTRRTRSYPVGVGDDPTRFVTQGARSTATQGFGIERLRR